MNDHDVIDLFRGASLGTEPPLRSTGAEELVRAGRRRAARGRAVRAISGLAAVTAVGVGIAVLPFGGARSGMQTAGGGPIVVAPTTRDLARIWPSGMTSRFTAGWVPGQMTQRRTAYYPDRHELIASRPGTGHSSSLPVGVTVSVYAPGAYPKDGLTSMATPVAAIGGGAAFAGLAPQSDSAGLRWEIAPGQWAQAQIEQGALDDPRHGDGPPSQSQQLLRKVAEKVALRAGPVRMPFQLASALPTLRVIEASAGHASWDKTDNATLRLTDTPTGMRKADSRSQYESGLTIRVFPAPTNDKDLGTYTASAGGEKARWQTEDGNPAYAGQVTVIRGKWAIDFRASREVLAALGGKAGLLAMPGQLTLAANPADSTTWFDWPEHASR
jgi:hypothetical protein